MIPKIICHAFGLILFATVTLGLGPTKKHCTLDLDPTGRYNCPPDFFCQSVQGGRGEWGKCIEEPKPSTIKLVHCTKTKLHCPIGQKCVASGFPEYGFCKPNSDPTVKYCSSKLDCNWWFFDTCYNGGCQSVLDLWLD